MLSPDALLEMHRRVHHGMSNLLDHCRQLTAEELQRALPAIGMPTVHEQLFHVIGAEAYWIMVLRGRYANGDLPAEEEARWEEANYPTVDALDVLRLDVAAATEAYLGETTALALATPTELYTYDRQPHLLVPQWVIMRIITHHFHHRGLVAAMCRMLGRPVPQIGSYLDFPLQTELPAK